MLECLRQEEGASAGSSGGATAAGGECLLAERRGPLGQQADRWPQPGAPVGGQGPGGPALKLLLPPDRARGAAGPATRVSSPGLGHSRGAGWRQRGAWTPHPGCGPRVLTVAGALGTDLAAGQGKDLLAPGGHSQFLGAGAGPPDRQMREDGLVRSLGEPGEEEAAQGDGCFAGHVFVSLLTGELFPEPHPVTCHLTQGLPAHSQVGGSGNSRPGSWALQTRSQPRFVRSPPPGLA